MKYKKRVEVPLLIVAVIGLLISVFMVPLQILFRTFSSRYDLAYYIHQINVAIDVLIGSIAYGSRHTVSALTGYYSMIDFTWHKTQESFIDGRSVGGVWLGFGKSHCKNEAIKENLIVCSETTKDI